MTDEERNFRAARAAQLRARARLLGDNRAEVLRLLREAERDVLAAIAEAGSDGERWHLTQLSREISRSLDEFGRDASATLTRASGEAWAGGQALVDAPLAAGGVRLAGIAPLVSTRQLSAMRAFMVDRIKDVGADAARKISTQLGLVVIGTKTPGEAVGEITRLLGEESRARAVTIVRTEISRVYAVASQERMVEVAARVPGLKKQWRRSGKLHPRVHHDLADGQVREVNEPFVLYPLGGKPVELMYPHDPAAPAGETINCGCTMIPIRESWTVSQPGRAPGGIAGEGGGETMNQILERLDSESPAAR